MPKPFQTVLDKFRKYAFSERDKGDKFERLMQAYLQTDPQYADLFKHVWLWNDFPARKDFGGKDTGIDLVALTKHGDYWAIQCKCYQERTRMDKASVDSFLSTSSRKFTNDAFETVGFTHRLWIDTTGKSWGDNAEETIRNQQPPVSRLNFHSLADAPVDWEQLEKGTFGKAARLSTKSPFEHQKLAIEKTHKHFLSNDRGKLIMACGTGKTYTALNIAEKETKGNGLVLFLVPSIALLGQTLREWSAEAREPIEAICICSDAAITKQKSKNEDTNGFNTVDLALPASTTVAEIVKQFDKIIHLDKKGLTVVFSTYQSIDVIQKAQAVLLDKQASNAQPFGTFDLIICDEAHRTTGVKLTDFDESAFVKVHSNDFIKAKKRLYMTATPRLFSEDSVNKAAQNNATLWSMDDPSVYGNEIYRIGFGEAVAKKLLTDYKVLVLTLSQNDVSPAVQKMLANDDNEIQSSDVSKLIGCINALSKQIIGDDALSTSDPEPMRRALAFCSNIKNSKEITRMFNDTSASYPNALPIERREAIVSVASDHIDGAMSAPLRDEKLSWLKEDFEGNECRVLTNVRCLSEGVDVPSLDAVIFLSQRNSQIDVVQSVGRVMRRAKGKNYGYIIIPVIVDFNVEPDVALDNNDSFKVVWSVLNALRAHDDRFNAVVNKIELNKERPQQIIVGRPLSTMYGNDDNDNPHGEFGDDENAYTKNAQQAIQNQLAIQFEQLQNVVFARMVQKVGDRRYWEQWAKDVADIAERQVVRINRLIVEKPEHRAAFKAFLKGLQKNINPAISQEEAVDMLSQHLITKPVFEALFEDYSFVKNNPISISMQGMLDLLASDTVEKDAETLQKFYDSVRKRASGINNSAGKQTIILELYDTFFKTAFPKMVEQLGIVYTPVEVVDFTIQSVAALLQKEFGRSISDENVHILDPFTGTGTFMTRLLQSGLIDRKDLQRKYQRELHANEIVLLAYYIAAVNIENAFHDAFLSPNSPPSGGKDSPPSGVGGLVYEAFNGICLTDTFQLGETDENGVERVKNKKQLLLEADGFKNDTFQKNSERVLAQKRAPLRIIIGNPPYSVGQKSANDNAQNQEYPFLDSRIEASYAKGSNATSVKALYDSYIKAFRWSSDRLGTEGGIIAFVTNGAWIDGNGMDGFRKSLEKEFTAIYVFNLRGNARTQGDLRRKEAGNVFGGGSRTPISITFLIKKPAPLPPKGENDNVKGKEANSPSGGKGAATIHYHDIGDYLSRDEKLKIIRTFGSLDNPMMDWQTLAPNEHGDWLNQRDDIFGTFIPLAAEKKFDTKSQSFFLTHSLGVASGRDSWVYNFSKKNLVNNMKRTIDFYNQQSKNFKTEKETNNQLDANGFVDADAQQISWNRNLMQDLERYKIHTFKQNGLVTSNYRPFCKQHLYFDKDFNAMLYQMPKLFPTPSVKNRVICVSGVGGNKDFSALITDCIPDLQVQFNGQCFPLYYYEENTAAQMNIFDVEKGFIRRDGVSDFILKQGQALYGKTVDKEALFYYVYGLLHSPTYRERFSSDLKKMLPRLPLVATAKDFWAFSKTGRALADLHIDYEKAVFTEGVNIEGAEHGIFTVDKMRFPSKTDKSKIFVNAKLTITNIPADAYAYVVNGKSAIEWVMERYQVTTHKDSGIRNNPNDWAEEVGNERYILDTLLRVITVSLKTVELVKSLPQLEF